MQKAQVLTLSDSKLQIALSLGDAGGWFLNHHLRAYFLGLSTAQSRFGTLLWERFKPHPQVLILDAVPYFSGGMGEFENSIIDDSKSRQAQLAELQDFQRFHQRYCAMLPALCGLNFAFFRSRIDGHWLFPDPNDRIILGRKSVPNDRANFPTDSIPN